MVTKFWLPFEWLIVSITTISHLSHSLMTWIQPQKQKEEKQQKKLLRIVDRILIQLQLIHTLVLVQQLEFGLESEKQKKNIKKILNVKSVNQISITIWMSLMLRLTWQIDVSQLMFHDNQCINGMSCHFW